MKNTALFICSIALLTLASCNKVADTSTEGLIRFNMNYPFTRASASGFEPGDAVSLYAVAWNGEVQMPLQVGGNWLNNEKISFDGSEWAGTRPLFWPEGACDFYALYPYQESVNSIESYRFSVALDQNTVPISDGLGGYESSDLLSASSENVLRGADGSVNLSFNHIMSKLVVNIVKGEKFEGEIPDDVTARIYNTVTDCFVNLSKGTVQKDPYGTRNTIVMKWLSNDRFEAVLVPQNIEKRTPLVELTMGGIAYLLETSISFRQGYVHIITLTINTSPDQEQIEISIDPNYGNWN